MEWMEPDWDELDRKADAIVARYALVSSAWNLLPPPLDVMGVTGTFAKMVTELAAVYQVMLSSNRARQMGWAIATGTASVLGVTYAGSRLLRFIPGGGLLLSALVQAPIVGAVAWAAGDVLKDYFKQTKRGVEPGVHSLRDSFAKTLHLKLKNQTASPENGGINNKQIGAAPSAGGSVGSAVEQIAALHDLLRNGAITQEEFDRKKADLLGRI